MLLSPVMTPEELNRFLDRDFPELNATRRVYVVTAVGPGWSSVRCEAGPEHLRPGGTVSGPTIMTLADITAWVTILAHIGPAALTVTTHLSIDFLRKPEPGHLHGKGRLLKLGKRLAVASVDIDGEDEDQPFAFASATYSIPPR
ncbi:PaaI family thioesterase [Chthonobacter albigriseus]|uniref:PaaI family thioesterase n=1 Tax=Chthonobacter albigriseus TaxID=1683161 RepID=UPI0015EF1C97|nr:PaaI family thioesterase [Chthonobacter albigriseus]